MDSFLCKSMEPRQLIVNICLAVLLLPGCTRNIQEEISRTSFTQLSTYKNTALGYSIDVPVETLTARHTPDMSKVGFINYDPYKTPTASTGIFISIQGTTSCDPFITGSSQMQSLIENHPETIWGRVDAYDFALNPNRMNVLCKPLNLKWEGKDENIAKATSFAYVLCSQKNQKAILVCISEERDNPDFAKRIFKTFQLTK